jgi:hypothetical protein
MTTYGIGQDSQTQEYIVYFDGTPTARYRMLADALAYIDTRREPVEEMDIAIETVTQFLKEREQGGAQ